MGTSCCGLKAKSSQPMKLSFSLFIFLAIIVCGSAWAEPLTVVAFGDSTTARRKGTEIYVRVLQDRLGADAVTILNKGIPRHTTSVADGRFDRDVTANAPDVVIIQFGINDSIIDVWADPPKTKPRNSIEKYEAQLRRFVRDSKAMGAEVILMTPNQIRWTPYMKERYGKPPYDTEDERGFNLHLKDYAEAVRKVAREEGADLVDVYAAYDDFEKATGKSASELLPDGMHPNTEGHKLVADLLEPLLLKAVSKRSESPQTSP
jgi:lysophospholipase L1-like esterase